MIMIYETVSNKSIRADGKKLKKQVADWFVANSRRRVCRVNVWYGKQVSFRKATIDTQVDEAIKAAIK